MTTQVEQLIIEHQLVIAETKSASLLLSETIALLDHHECKHTYYAAGETGLFCATSGSPRQRNLQIAPSVAELLVAWPATFVSSDAVTNLILDLSISDEVRAFMGDRKVDCIGLFRRQASVEGVLIIRRSHRKLALAYRSIVRTTAVLFQARSISTALEYFIQQEFTDASEVQAKLLNSGNVSNDQVEYCVAFQPLKVVSGDFYDTAILPKGRFFFAVGDAAGKGVSAALVMALVLTHLRRERQVWGVDLLEIFYSLHKALFECSPTTKYATLVCGLVDVSSLTLQYVSAGHQPLALYVTKQHESAGWQISELDVSSPAVGLLREPPAPYKVGRMSLQPGDILVVATDGLTDGENQVGESWGANRFRETVRIGAAISNNVSDICSWVIKQQEHFCAGAKPADDITLFAMRALPTRK